MAMEAKNVMFYRDEAVMMDDARDPIETATLPPPRSPPPPKPRSLSDGGANHSAPKLDPSPHIRRTRDDSSLKETEFSTAASSTSASTSVASPASTPTTPRRGEFPRRGLSLKVPPPSQREFGSPVPQTTPTPSAANANAYLHKQAPLSPKLDPSQVFASPTNILPRRSRGLDFSRAATSLHHSTLADQSSPDSSPTIGGGANGGGGLGGRAMNIPGRRAGGGDFSSTEQSSTSLWSMMGSQERMHISSSLGSVAAAIQSDSSSSSDDDLMDEDMEEAYITTPQAGKGTPVGVAASPWGGQSSLMSFQQRQRPKRLPRKRLRGPLGLGFGSNLAGAGAAGLSRSPPNNHHGGGITKDSGAQSRRESISWQANQLHISGSEGEEGSRMGDGTLEGVLATPGLDGQRSVIRRVVTRRGNLLPKTKTFARIRAALAEEGAPIEADLSREAEVVRQVRESDMDLEPPRISATPVAPLSAPTTSQSSPNIGPQECPEDVVGEDEMITDPALGISSFKQAALKNSKGKVFWDTFSESSGSVAGSRTPPPPPASFRPRGSSSGISDDIRMDSPVLAAAVGFVVPTTTTASSDSQRSDATQPIGPLPPSAAEITRRINNKRRRDDDFDPTWTKRRAVSPGMSVQNSPVMQSPLQRENAPWGSRPGSNGGDRGGSGAGSESGSLTGTPSGLSTGGRADSRKVRVGFQGMSDTNDGIMRMSIE